MTRVKDFDKYKKKFKRFLLGKNNDKGIIYKIFIYYLLFVIGFIFLYPLFYIFSLSLKNLDDLLDASVVWVPKTLFFENYRLAAEVLKLPNKFSDFFKLNTLYKSVIVIIIPSLCSTMACCVIGYGFSRFNFPLKKLWLALIIISFIVPQQIIMLPQFVWFNNTLNILGTIWTYIFPAITGQGINSAVFILIFYSFFNMIPKSLDEAALLDGAGEIDVFLKIGVRLSFQPIIISFLFSFVWYWNDYYRASYFLIGSKWTTLPLELARFESTFLNMLEEMNVNLININEPIIMAATILSILPILLIYFFLQRYFVESIDRTGITGE